MVDLFFEKYLDIGLMFFTFQFRIKDP